MIRPLNGSKQAEIETFDTLELEQLSAKLPLEAKEKEK